MQPVPICLIVDDPCPGLHLYFIHAARRAPEGRDPLTADGRPLLPTMPNAMIERFCEIAEEFGIRGKFSVVPRPGVAGSINSRLEGVAPDEMKRWLDVARRRVTPHFDITPEMITHDWAMDLSTLQPLSENEHDWSQRQTVETLRPYIAFALEELRQAGFRCHRKSPRPGTSASRSRPTMARAILQAQEQVYGRRDTSVLPELPGRRGRAGRGDDPRDRCRRSAALLRQRDRHLPRHDLADHGQPAHRPEYIARSPTCT